MSHQVIVQLVIAYVCVGVFATTAFLTVASLAGWIKIPDKKQQNKLFYILIVEVILIGIGYFGNWLKLDVGKTVEVIEDEARAEMDPVAARLFREGKEAFATQPELAESKFADAARIEPRNYQVRLNLGVTRLQLEKYASALTELQAAEELFKAMPEIERTIEKQILVASSLVAGYARNKDFARVKSVVGNLTVKDVGDSLSALYVNAADGMFQAGNWVDTVDYGRRAAMVAQAFDLYDRELAAMNVQANALYHLPGRESESMMLLDDATAKAKTYPLDPTTRRIHQGHLLNTRGLFWAKDVSEAKQESAIKDFTDAIELLEPLVQLRGDLKITLASAYGNRADAYARRADVGKSIKDRSVAINLFIQRNWRQGVSSQLSEIARDILAANGKAADAYAAARAAIQLGGDKPAVDQQDDNQLLSQATARTTAGERATVNASLSIALTEVTGVPAKLWRTAFNLN